MSPPRGRARPQSQRRRAPCPRTGRDRRAAPPGPPDSADRAAGSRPAGRRPGPRPSAPGGAGRPRAGSPAAAEPARRLASGPRRGARKASDGWDPRAQQDHLRKSLRTVSYLLYLVSQEPPGGGRGLPGGLRGRGRPFAGSQSERGDSSDEGSERTGAAFEHVRGRVPTLAVPRREVLDAEPRAVDELRDGSAVEGGYAQRSEIDVATNLRVLPESLAAGR